MNNLGMLVTYRDATRLKTYEIRIAGRVSSRSEFSPLFPAEQQRDEARYSGLGPARLSR